MTAGRLLLVALVLGILSISAVRVFAQSDDPQIDQIQSLIERRAEKVEHWRSEAREILGMTVAVGLLGIAAGGIQSFKAGWVKPATIAVGLVVSSLTLIQSTVFKTDHRQLLRAASQAEQQLDEAKLILPQARNARNGDDWAVLVDEIKTRLFRIDALEQQLLSGESASGAVPAAAVATFSLVASAEAAESAGEPSWVSEPPTGTDSVYFVGLGSSPSLGEAKRASNQDAVDQALDHFALAAERLETGTLDPDALSRKIVELANIASTYSTFDPKTGAWRYYTLLRLPRSKIESAVQFYGIEQREAVGDALSGDLATSAMPPNTYFSRRKAAYDQLLVAGESTLPSAAWTAFAEARDLRRTGRSDEAVEPLQKLVTDYPSFYLGWYNLGLALHNLGRSEDAAAAYRRAIELEPEQAVRDASVYNTYGYLLYQMGRYEDAIEPLERALEIAPDHAKAKRTLLATRQALSTPK